jgi:hypothetical protein
MQIDYTGAHFAEEIILHPHRPCIAVWVRSIAARQAAVFGLDPRDPIHLLSIRHRSAMDKDQLTKQFRG